MFVYLTLATVDSNLTFSFLKMLECYFRPFIPREGHKPIPVERQERISELIEPWFIFSFLWTIGATCENESRKRLDGWMRKEISAAGMTLPFPESGLVYDYRLDDAGISSPAMDEEEEEELKTRQVTSPNIKITLY